MYMYIICHFLPLFLLFSSLSPSIHSPSRDHLSEYTLSLAAGVSTDYTPQDGRTRGRSAASYTRVLFEQLQAHLSATDTSRVLFVKLIPQLLASLVAHDRLVYDVILLHLYIWTYCLTLMQYNFRWWVHLDIATIDHLCTSVT